MSTRTGTDRWLRPPPALALAVALFLAACGGRIVPPGEPGMHGGQASLAGRPAAPMRRPVPAAPIAPGPAASASAGPVSAIAAGVSAGPAIATLLIAPDNAATALAAFRASCPSLLRRPDLSGLTRAADWRPACDAAGRTDPGNAAGFFRQWFEAVQVGDGRAFATGYYVPEIAAARERGGAYQTPVYARPDDLIDVDLGRFSPALTGRHVRGRVSGTALVPYPDRAQIEAGAIGAHARVLAWAADPVAFFFLQIQGSGVLRLPDGTALRIGYDTQNGRDYTGIGALMRTRGLLGPGQASMQGIVGWLHDHPDQAPALMDENRSFVFFRPLAGDAVGSLGLPVVGGVSAAADPHFVPLGAPVLLSTDRADASRLWVAQDTGGAIKGANRFDTFWGTGDGAAAVAGGMSAHGAAFLLLPAGTLARAAAGGSAADAGPAAR